MNEEFALFPESASTAAPIVDGLYTFLVLLSAVLTIGVAAVIIYFAIKYRGGSAAFRGGGGVKTWVEVTWLVAPLPILLLIFLWGAKAAFYMHRVPDDAMQIDVVAKQWMWKFQHASGQREIDTLHVPVGRPVRMRMISQDVIHSFFVPAFRVKQDVLPGKYYETWFEATKPGEYRLYCAEYCGTNHSRMKGVVVAMTPTDFEDWLSGETADETPVIAGQRLFEQMRCDTCHRGGGQQSRGPALEALFRKQVPLVSGENVLADEAYLRESILRPAAKVVAGYEPIMPAFEEQIDEEGILSLIAYIKSLGSDAPGPTPQVEEEGPTP
ncbi:MAG: cytochrome c oxidase subunit II [Pirellulales bacterium]